jgi:hypothetical protein
MSKEKPIWFAGVCDSLLRKLKAWHEGYDFGKPGATCPFMEMTGRIVAKVVKRAHTICFSQAEMDNLYKFVNYYSTNPALTAEVKAIAESWRNGLLMPGGMRKVTLLFFPEHVKEIYDMVSRAKREAILGASVEDLIRQSKDSGKDLFEA